MIEPEFYEEIERIVGGALENPEKVTQWEFDFCKDFAEKLSQYGARVNVSPKQYDIIERIRGKIDG